jgi:hypothetical protein
MKRWIGPAAALLLFATALALPARAQEGQEASPVAALTSALVAACRQNEAQFARYLTAENAAAFRDLPASERTAFLKRLVLVDQPGHPLVSSDAQGHTVLRCDTPAATVEFRFGAERIHENLAFILVDAGNGQRTEFGMVREGGGWRMLSLGLLLLDLAELKKEWAREDLEARETTATRTLLALADALQTYQRAFGNLPESLEQLGPAPKEGVSPDAAGLVDADLAAGKKGGYLFRYRILPEGGGAGASFELAAVPVEYGTSGRRSFFLDASGKLHGADKQGGVATDTDPVVEPQKRE